jgi:hypothetical protein
MVGNGGGEDLENALSHKARGLAAAILSSSMCNSSQFIAPPLPGHLSTDMRWTTPINRDRSCDDNNINHNGMAISTDDLKRDINLDSMFLNQHNTQNNHRHHNNRGQLPPEEMSTIMMTSSHYLRQEPEKTMIMMMMANAGPGIEQQASRNFAGSSLDAAALLLPHNKSSAQKSSANVNF